MANMEVVAHPYTAVSGWRYAIWRRPHRPPGWSVPAAPRRIFSVVGTQFVRRT